MAVEIVLLAPVMMAFMMLVVAGGRYVAVRGDIEAASRDAVRAASLERDVGTAQAAAVDTAIAALQHPDQCQDPELSGNFVSGGMITVTLTCEVSYDGLGLIGLPGTKRITISSSAPIDVYRRTG
ncbi:pilus assembly protein [Streptomyces sp. SID13031]|nr:TadE family protein [Streptomyces sp. SID13031]NEA31505.1 pilus assembly protein [Streptomyces sp. SID13031]